MALLIQCLNHRCFPWRENLFSLGYLQASDTGKFEGGESGADAIPSPYAERYPQIKRTFPLLNKQYQQKDHKKFFCRFKAADQLREPLLEQ